LPFAAADAAADATPDVRAVADPDRPTDRGADATAVRPTDRGAVADPVRGANATAIRPTDAAAHVVSHNRALHLGTFGTSDPAVCHEPRVCCRV